MITKINRREGFTLVEMIIVIAIIGILMTIAFTGLRNVQKSARDTARMASIRTAQQYLELYYNKNNKYPDSGVTWEALGAALYADKIIDKLGDWPNDPQDSGVAYTVANTNFKYNSCSSVANAAKNLYTLGVVLETAKVNAQISTDPCSGKTGAGTTVTCGTVYCISN